MSEEDYHELAAVYAALDPLEEDFFFGYQEPLRDCAMCGALIDCGSFCGRCEPRDELWRTS